MRGRPGLLLLAAVAGTLLAQRAGASSPNCTELATKKQCVGRNGCAWCTGGADGLSAGPGCYDWRQCTGPPDACVLKHNESTCAPPLRKGGSQGGGGIERWGAGDEISGCAWCKVEQRCVEAGQGVQCMGCDGMFDSGAEDDVCGVCGGGCENPYVDMHNPFCPCLGCDNVPFSNLTMDACGVCGGTNSTCFPFQSLTRQESIGIVLALCGNVLISISLNTQKYAHNMNELDSGGSRPYVELPIWWVGMTLMVLGETGNFLAYAYAPATLVAPLGAITVISNCILAHYVLKEELSQRNLWGVLLAIVGAVFIVTYAPSSEKQLTMDLLEQYMAEKGFIAYIVCLLAMITSLFLTKDVHKKRYVVIYVLICSLTGSMTVMCVKGVSTALILTFQGHNQFVYVVPWLLLVTTIGTILIQMRYLNLAMMNFGAFEVVPVYYVLFTFCSILGGMVLYKEYHQNCPVTTPDCHYTLWFLAGCAITFSGVYLITFSPSSAAEDASPKYRPETLFGGENPEAAETDRLLGGSDLDEEGGVPSLSWRARELDNVSGSGHSGAGSAQQGGGYLPSEL